MPRGGHFACLEQPELLVRDCAISSACCGRGGNLRLWRPVSVQTLAADEREWAQMRKLSGSAPMILDGDLISLKPDGSRLS
jgi:hypothetical protein